MRCVPDVCAWPIMRALVGFLLISVIGLFLVEVPGAAAEPFRWDPPQLNNPETVVLPSGPSYTRLARDRDYVINLPQKVKTGFTMIEGGRNIVIIGGHVAVPAGAEVDTERRGLYIKNATGIVHVEGVLIEGDEPSGFDAIAISAPSAIVQIVNVRVEGVTGQFDGFHGDIVQPFGGVRELRIDHLTGTSNYQGLYLAETNGRIGSVDIRNVDLDYTTNRFDETTYLLWLPVDSRSCETYPIRLEDVYIEPRPDQDVAGYAVWPNSLRPELCSAVEDEGLVDWPDLSDVEGGVVEGAPPGGDFVGRGEVGINHGGRHDHAPAPGADVAARTNHRGNRGLLDVPMSGAG